MLLDITLTFSILSVKTLPSDISNILYLYFEKSFNFIFFNSLNFVFGGLI